MKAIRAKKEIEERQNDEDIQNLNQAIREFDRSQLKKIDADEATEAVDDDQSSLLQEDGGGVAPPDDLTDDNDDVAEESQSTEEGSDDDDQPGNENEAANIQSSNSSFEGRKIQLYVRVAAKNTKGHPRALWPQLGQHQFRCSLH